MTKRLGITDTKSFLVYLHALNFFKFYFLLPLFML